ncbi:MAG: glyoxylate/hydroxypyruvate reductase A [Paracoccaceae bacterium]
MPITALFVHSPEQWSIYGPALRAAFADLALEVNLVQETDDPSTVDYIIYAPSGALKDFSPFTNLKAVLSLWAGVEKIEGNASIKVPICRMVDPGMSEGMLEYVTGHILRHHLGMDKYIHAQDGIWRNDPAPPLARDRRVGFLGLGALGMACANAARGLGFNVSGWSRTLKTLDGITTYCDTDGLHQMLAQTEILVLLLPATAATGHILNAETLNMMPDGAFIINPGRGMLIEDAALLTALDQGKIAHATLDVFHTEPLPPAHPFWAHPRVTVTPHIASETRPETAARTIAQNIERGQKNRPFLHMVDRKAGY